MNSSFRKISILIPVYNERETIGKIIDLALNADVLSLQKEIIIINDGSNDDVIGLLHKYEERQNIILLNHKTNQGKGCAIRTGLKKSSGEIVLIQDADLEYSPEDYPNLIKPIIGGYADVVYGSRFINSNAHRVLYYHHYLANIAITTLSNLFTNLNLTDIEVGYKVFKGELIRKIGPTLQSKRFGFEPEITAKIAKIKGIRIYEVGISYFGRTYTEGKKITWMDGIKAIFQVIKYNIFK